MHRRLVIAFPLLPLASGPAAAQPSQDPFRQIDYSAILPEHGLVADYDSLTDGSQIYVPPMFRYRLKLKTSGVVQQIAEPRRKAIERWSSTFRGQDFTERFAHEVEVTAGGEAFWLPWQQSLLRPFNDEMRNGGTMSVKVLFAGAIKGQLLLMAIGYHQL